MQGIKAKGDIRKGGSLKPRPGARYMERTVMDAYLAARYCGRETVCPGPTAGNRLIPLYKASDRPNERDRRMEK